jgi:hypothetical protein
MLLCEVIVQLGYAETLWKQSAYEGAGSARTSISGAAAADGLLDIQAFMFR